MAVKEVELLCFEYLQTISDIESLPSGLYGLDNRRTELHDRICELLNVDKQKTKKITDNLRVEDGTELYLALLEISRI